MPDLARLEPGLGWTSSIIGTGNPANRPEFERPEL